MIIMALTVFAHYHFVGKSVFIAVNAFNIASLIIIVIVIAALCAMYNV